MPARLADLTAVIDPSTTGAPEAEAAACAPELVREFVSRLGLPTRLSEVGVGEDAFDLRRTRSARSWLKLRDRVL